MDGSGPRRILEPTWFPHGFWTVRTLTGLTAVRDYATQTKNLVAAGYSPEDVAAAIDKLRTANQGRGIG